MAVRLTPRGVLMGAACALVFLLILGRALRVPYTSTVQERATGTVGEISGALEAGQLFESLRPRLSGVALQIATFGRRTNTEDVIFELREGLAGDVRRTVTVNAKAFRDHQRYLFSFEPLPDSRGKVYAASLRSPTSRPGNAITLDYSSGNPYAKVGPSSMFLLRTGRTSPEAIARSVKPQADLAFAVQHHIRLTELVRVSTLRALAALRENPRRWRLEAILVGSAVLLALATLPRPRAVQALLSPRWLPYAFGILVILGVLLRLLYARHLPATNDEGTALYDAWTVRQGRLPGGDGILKTPVFVSVLAGGLAVLGPSLANGRLLSVLLGALTAVPLAAMVRRFGFRPESALALAALWLLGSAPAIFTLYLHAQPYLIFVEALGMAALCVVLLGGQTTNGETAPRAPRDPPSPHAPDVPGSREGESSHEGWVKQGEASAGVAGHSDIKGLPVELHWRRIVLPLVAGVIFGLAFGIRKTALALALPVLVLLLLSRRSWRARLRVLVLCTVGAGVALAALGAVEYRLYGTAGVRYFLGIETAKIDPDTTASPEERRSALIKGVLPFFREAHPLIFLALVGLGGGLELFARGSRTSGAVRARALWGVPLLLAWWGRSFVQANERSEHLAFGLLPHWWAILGALLVLALLPRPRPAEPLPETDQPRSRALLGLALSWFVGLTVIYASWVKFTANYLAEFLVPIALLAVLGAWWLMTGTLRFRRAVLLGAGLLIVWGAYTSARSGYTFPHTGTFDLSSLREAVAIVRATVPQNEPLLTAALMIPVESGHRVPFDVAHPTHYAYGFIEPRVRNIYMAPAEEMVRTVLSEVRWVVHERLTAFSYYREYPEIEAAVRTNFEPIAEIENLRNPLTLLRRKHPR